MSALRARLRRGAGRRAPRHRAGGRAGDRQDPLRGGAGRLRARPRLPRGLGSVRGGRGRSGLLAVAARPCGSWARTSPHPPPAPTRTRRASRCGRASRSGWPGGRASARWRSCSRTCTGPIRPRSGCSRTCPAPCATPGCSCCSRTGRRRAAAGGAGRLAGFSDLELDGLDAGEVAQLAEAMSGRRGAGAEARSLQERTRGNPLYVSELVRALAADGTAVPSGLRTIIARRAATLPPTPGTRSSWPPSPAPSSRSRSWRGRRSWSGPSCSPPSSRRSATACSRWRAPPLPVLPRGHARGVYEAQPARAARGAPRAAGGGARGAAGARARPARRRDRPPRGDGRPWRSRRRTGAALVARGRPRGERVLAYTEAVFTSTARSRRSSWRARHGGRAAGAVAPGRGHQRRGGRARRRPAAATSRRRRSPAGSATRTPSPRPRSATRSSSTTARSTRRRWRCWRRPAQARRAAKRPARPGARAAGRAARPDDRAAAARGPARRGDRYGPGARRPRRPGPPAGAVTARELAPESSARRDADAAEVLALAAAGGDREAALWAHIVLHTDRFADGDIAGADAELADYDRLTGELRQRYYRWYGKVLHATRAIFDGRLEAGRALAAEAVADNREHEQDSEQEWVVQQLLLARIEGRPEDVPLEPCASSPRATPPCRCGAPCSHRGMGRRESRGRAGGARRLRSPRPRCAARRRRPAVHAGAARRCQRVARRAAVRGGAAGVPRAVRGAQRPDRSQLGRVGGRRAAARPARGGARRRRRARQPTSSTPSRCTAGGARARGWRSRSATTRPRSAAAAPRAGGRGARPQARASAAEQHEARPVKRV